MSSFLSDSESHKTAMARRLVRESLVAERRLHQKEQVRRSDETKIEAVRTWLALGGNTLLTAAATGIPRSTLILWKSSKWWEDVVTTLRKEDRLTVSVKTGILRDAAMKLLLDRVENGDFVFDQKTGQMIRKPMKGVDLHKVAVDMLDRKEVIDKSTSEQVVVENNEDKLLKLAEQFAQLASKSLEKAPVKVTDIVYIQEEKKP